MTTFLLDLWQDLREKRLWPVAVALLAATAAVPLLLFQPASHPGSTGASAAPNAPAESLPVVTIADSKGSVSKLDAFAEKNPFKPLKQPAPSTSTPSAGSSGKGSGASAPGGASGAPGNGTGTGGSGGTTPGGSSVTTTHTQQLFAFHVDVRFGKRGHVKSYKDLKQMSMLPNAKTPLVIFMGMKDFNTAIFLIDAKQFQADGEGKCSPSRSTCSFVYLKTDESSNEETLAANDGTEYTLKLSAVNKVNLSDKQSQAVKSLPTNKTSAGKGTAKGKVAAAKDAATGGKAHGEMLFDLPSFASLG